MAKYGDPGVVYGTLYQYIPTNHAILIDSLTVSPTIDGMSLSLIINTTFNDLTTSTGFDPFDPSFQFTISVDSLSVSVSMADLPVVLSPFDLSTNQFSKTLRSSGSITDLTLREYQSAGFKKVLREDA